MAKRSSKALKASNLGNWKVVKEELDDAKEQVLPLAASKATLSKKKKLNKLSEIKRFKQVLNVKEFKDNPCAAIQLHLLNSK